MAKRTLPQASQLTNDVHNFHINIDNREIFLGSYIGDLDNDPGVDYRMAAALSKNIRLLDSLGDGNIIIYLQTNGGCVSQGFSIYDMITWSRCHVTILGSGEVCSMGTLILQAGDKKVLTPNVEFLVHPLNLAVDGNHITYKSFSSWMERRDNAMIDIYVKSCKKGEYFIKNQMDEAAIRKFLSAQLQEKQDWYMTAQEAVYYGFADGVLGDKKFETLDIIREL